MDMQNVSSLQIPEGIVRTIHDKDNRLLWGRVAYNTKYAGNTIQNGAPTPDAPVPVQTVTGEQTVKVSGKNLFDKNTVVLYNGYFSAGGRITGDDFSDLTKGTNRFFYIPCEPNTTYSIIKPLQATTSRNRFRVGTQPVLNITSGATLNDFWYMNDGGTTTTHTITTGVNANYLFVYFANATTATDPGGEIQGVLDGLQIEKGSATAYEPYRGQSYEINLGKNLFNKDNYSSLPGYFASDKAITNGVTNRNIVFYLPCKPNTVYSLQRMSSGGGSCLVGTTTQLPAYDVTVDNVMTWSATTNGYTTGSAAQYLCLRYQTATSTTSISSVLNDLVSSIQVEQNLTATSYASYFEPIELCKLGNYQDYIYKSGDDWYVHKACGKQIVDTSTIALRDTYTNVEYAMFGKPADYGGYGSFGSTYPIVCTHAIQSTNPGNWDSASNAGRLYSGAETLRLWIGFAKGTGLDAIKTKLTGCINYYALGTPTDTKITDTTLIGQLNDAYGWLTRYGYNVTVGGNIPIIIDKTNL